MPILAAIGGLIGLSGAAVGTLATIAGIVFWLLRIHAIIAIIGSAMWFLVAYFAKDLFSWGIDVFFSLAGSALSIFGLHDPTDKVLALLQQLPPALTGLWKRLHMYSHMQEIAQAYSINWALSSIPIVGRLFRSS